VPDEALHRILDIARFAPSGGNRQAWHVIVVDDRPTRQRLAELRRPTWNVYVAQLVAGEDPWNTVVPTAVDVVAAEEQMAPSPLLDALSDVPRLLVIGIDLRRVASFDRRLDRVGVISGASVYPFVWSLLLAARAEGYGGTLTTFLAGREPEAQAVLGLPEHVAVAAMVPLGRPRRPLSRLRRRPVEEFTTVERFDGLPFRPLR
jgi:nitroreductase